MKTTMTQMPWRKEESMDAVAKMPVIVLRTPTDHVRLTTNKVACFFDLRPALSTPNYIRKKIKMQYRDDY